VCLTLVLAAIFLAVLLLRIPHFITGRIIRQLGRWIGEDPYNQFQRASLPRAGHDPIARSSPDMFYLLGVFDASTEPVRVRCFVPEGDRYWSIALHAVNPGTFYVLNDRMAKPGELELIIVGPGGTHEKKGNETVVRAPAAVGIVMIRAVVNPEDPHEVAQMRELQHRSTISRYSDTVERRPKVQSGSPGAGVDTTISPPQSAAAEPSLRLHHAGFVVGSIPHGVEDFCKKLHTTWDGKITHDPDQKVRVCFLELGNSLVELVEPAAPDSPVGRFLEKGGGLHHLCYEVDDLDAQLETLAARGVVITSPPQPAAAFGGRRIAWVMTGQRLLLEFLESAR
jgi:methylmalonyl-CoA/ethylmalonyl-CoA epimerase